MPADRPPVPTLALVAISAAVALPLCIFGALLLVGSRADGAVLVAVAVYAAMIVLSVRPIRVIGQLALNPSDVAVLFGVLFLAPPVVAVVAAAARLTVDVLARRGRLHVLRNASAVAITAAAAGVVYERGAEVAYAVLPGLVGAAPDLVIAGILAAAVLVAVDTAQIVALFASLRNAPAGGWSRYLARTVPTQLLWSIGSMTLYQLGSVEPWVLGPAVPLLIFGYLNIRARFVAERRNRHLTTLVDIARNIGTSLDTAEVFRGVHSKVREVFDVDALFVVTVDDREPDVLNVRFRVDRRVEVAPSREHRPGSMVGACLDRGEPLLIHDIRRDPLGQTLAPGRVWGATRMRSAIYVPMRINPQLTGTITVESERPDAYDQGDVELLVAIANEAAVAIDRADLYAKSTTLSRRLFDLQRVGLELMETRDLGVLTARFSAMVVAITGAQHCAVYLDHGGDTLEQAAIEGPANEDSLTLAKDSAMVAPILRGERVELPDVTGLPGDAHSMTKRHGHGAVVMQPLRTADQVIGGLFMAWPERHELSADDRDLLDLLSSIGATALRSVRLYAELDEAYLATVQKLTTTIQARDGYRDDHVTHIAGDAVALGERLGLPEAKLRDLRYASLFHSLGKIGVPASVLSKAGPLTTEEERLLREHPVLGARILESIRFLRGVVPIVRHANERWDGGGYPDGLAYEAIPYEARLLHIVIAYHAMLTDRPYRKALPADVALSELQRQSGTRYDPGLASEFISMIQGRGAVQAAERQIAAGARELAILAEITPEFSTLLDLSQLLTRVLDILHRNMPECRMTIALRDEQTQELAVRALAGDPGNSVPGSRIAPGSGLSGWVLEHRQAQIVDDVRNEPRYVGSDPEVRSVVAVPLINDGRGIGVLMSASPHVGAFSQADLTLLQAVAAQIAAAIEVAELHERIKRAANTDALTGLHNYRYFYDRLEEEIARAARRNSSLAVAFFDIDKLKRVNDTYGHLAGNEVLRSLGRVIDANLRHEDVPARYGGDEFVIVMPDTPRDEAEKVVSRVMELLDRAEVFIGEGQSIAMPSRSWGVAVFPIDGTTPAELVDNADTRAYASKRAKA